MALIFERSWQLGEDPEDRKEANVSLILKKARRTMWGAVSLSHLTSS